MNVIDKAKSHFKEQLAGGMKTIYVEEWDETIYFKPSANFAEQTKVLELHQKGKLTEALIETLMTRALNAEGKRMFSFGDKDTLMREVDPEIIVRICAIINKGEAEAEQHLGN